MAEFHFLRPSWLLSLLPLVLLWWVLWRGQDSYSKLRKLVAPHLLPHLVVDHSASRRLRPLHLLFVLWVISAFALAGPTWQREQAPFADDEAGLVVLLKASGTMNATDVQPSRLERAKHKLRDLLQQRQGAATGLIVYSGSAHLVMPLTRDDRIVNAMMEGLSPDLMPADGDALTDALKMAEQLLQRAQVPGSVLVMADSVAPSQADQLSSLQLNIPVQFLSLSQVSAPLDQGMSSAAASVNSSITRLSVDQADVETIARRAASSFDSVAGVSSGERWRDAGYFFLPLIAIFSLMWSRKGWLIR